MPWRCFMHRRARPFSFGDKMKSAEAYIRALRRGLNHEDAMAALPELSLYYVDRVRFTEHFTASSAKLGAEWIATPSS